MIDRSAACLSMGLVLLAASCALGQPGEPDPARHGWLSSLEEGKARAARSGKPLMVVLRCVP